MITLQELSSYLDSLLSPVMFIEDCPNGLQLEGKREIKRVATAVSASVAAIDQAIDLGADALIVHHGLFWAKDPLPVLGPKKLKLEKLLSRGISLFAYHLPLDAHPQLGNNWKAAIDLGWTQLQPFGTFRKMSIGVRGTFVPLNIEEFQQKLEHYYGHSAHVALGGKKEITSCGLISGGAHWSILEAADQSLDCYITGSFDEPIWDIAHERKINFFALGHYATERIGVRALAQELKNHFKIPTAFVDLPNPF
jgi:dinuclear metal center YbgI/SA1388 family protein